MNSTDIKKLLQDVADGKISPEGAIDHLKAFPFSDLGFAKQDSHRPLRNGFSEVIFCQGKRLDHLLRILDDINARGHNAFGTRADDDVMSEIARRFPDARCDSTSRTFRIINRPTDPISGKLAILCAGTADVPIAEEARHTCEFFGLEAKRFYDVGIAGLHRILSCAPELSDIDCAIVVAGMEGALPSVAGGLTPAPIIAVPTSVGYGASFNGIAALLAMLNSCSEGIVVVNIDNGFGAACAALRMIRRK